jgi:hypothetical protein
MKKNTLFVITCLFFLTAAAQQRKKVYITTNLPIKFKTYLDGQLQFAGECSNLIILNVPQGEKKLLVKVMTPSNQQPSIAIAKSSEKEEFYKIEKLGETYILKSNPEGQKQDKTFFSRTGYTPKQKPYVKDTSIKNAAATCQVSDSILNKFIVDLGSLKNAKAKKEFALNYMKRKCLYTHQIKSIGYRIDDDAARFEMYKVLFYPALDRNKFLDLVSSFQSQKYGNMFMDWFEDQKF